MDHKSLALVKTSSPPATRMRWPHLPRQKRGKRYLGFRVERLCDMPQPSRQAVPQESRWVN